MSMRSSSRLCSTVRRSPIVTIASLIVTFLGVSFLTALTPSSPALAVSTACPWVGSAAPISQRVGKLLAKMTVAQKVALLTGTSGSRYVGFVPAIGSLCVPALKMEDGPAGVGDGMTGVTQLPAPVNVAATWDTSAEQTYGHLIGAEQAAKGTTVDLGPTINIVRDPRWGRAFESIGEDPYLNGTMGAANIRCVQSIGVMAMVKHLAVYNQETNRNTAADNAVVRNQATQEIYLPAFQAAVQQGAASSVMCSYSYINGTAACQNPYTLRTVLRHQDGFGGFVTSDWGATHSTPASANAGLDMDMPGSDGYFGSALQTAVSNGSVSTATLNSMVSHVLTEMFAFGLFDKPTAGSPSETATNATDQAHAAALAESSSIAIVFASYAESEGSDLTGIDLGSKEDSLISAVAAANPRTIVVLNTGSAVTMPWLSSVAGVLEAWYPGQEDGTAIASILFGNTDPSGHLPVTFPTSLSQVPASTAAQWPGTNGTVDYSEGIDAGRRWYQAHGLTPLFPFGYGSSYTSFSFSNLRIGSLTAGGAATVSATVTNTGSRAGADVVQLYADDPPASGQPPEQLDGFQRVYLQPEASQRVTFHLTQHNLQYWNSRSNSWATSTGSYGIKVGDSSANLPLSGTLSVSSAQLGQPVTITSPGPQEGIAGSPVSVPVSASDSDSGQSLSYAATGLPAGLSISPTSGTISGLPTTPGTSTVTLTASDGTGAFATATFTWTVVSGLGAGIAGPGN